jgi:hypothetical protein
MGQGRRMTEMWKGGQPLYVPLWAVPVEAHLTHCRKSKSSKRFSLCARRRPTSSPEKWPCRSSSACRRTYRPSTPRA